MYTIFINSKNIKASDPHRLFFNLTVKIDLEEKINILFYQILAFAILGKI